MHDMQHTLRHMIYMMCNYLGKHGQHKINLLAKSRSRSSKTNLILITYRIFNQYYLILSQITRDLEYVQSERQNRKKENRRENYILLELLLCLHCLGVMPSLLVVGLGELSNSSIGSISNLDEERRQEERKKIRTQRKQGQIILIFF